jgi:acetate kinase
MGILALNSGSSSLKFGLFDDSTWEEWRRLTKAKQTTNVTWGNVNGHGLSAGSMRIWSGWRCYWT